MTETATLVDALFAIAQAINNLNSSISGIAFIMLLFLVFKKMGADVIVSNEKK